MTSLGLEKAAPPVPRQNLPDRAVPEGGHIPALDGVRGLAILAVMVFHQTVMTSDTAADRFFLRFAQFGWCGVDLFFVLSGFLITGILLGAKGSQHYLRNFYARRVLRIFPLYYAVLVFSIVILPHIHHPKAANFGRIAGEEAWYVFYLQNYLIAWHASFRHGILDVTWSLAIEEQFYVVWPVVVLLLRPRACQGLCMAVAGLALALRIAAFGFGLSPVAVYVATPTRLDGLAAGAFAALAAHRSGGVAQLLPRSRFLALASGIALFGVWLSPQGYSWESPLTATVGFSLLAVFFAAGLLLAVGSSPKGILHWILAHPLLRAFGKYSYAMYLFHLPLRALIRDTVFGSGRFPVIAGSQLPGQFLFYFASSAITFLASWASWHVFEKQVLKLKRLFPREERPPAPANPGCGSDAAGKSERNRCK